MFVAYHEQSKAYKLLDVFTNKIVINRDVLQIRKIPTFLINGSSTNSSVWVINDSGTNYSVEIKQEMSRVKFQGGDQMEKIVSTLSLYNKRSEIQWREK